MIKIEKLSKSKRYIPENGDILYGNEFIAGKVKKEEINSILMLFRNSWNALEKLGIDILYKDQMAYECPYRYIQFYWFYPTFLICQDHNIYKSKVDCRRFDILTDADYWINFVKICDEKPNKIHMSFLGHGYTSGTLPSDGHGTPELVYVNLSNGDKIAGFVWIWYNK